MLVLTTLLFACDDPSLTSVPEHAVDGARIDPPVTMSLAGGFAFIGESTTFTVTGAAPGAQVLLLRGHDAPPGGCLPTPDPVCLDIGAPLTPLGVTTASAAGTATFTWTIPVSVPDGASLRLQALSWTGATPMSAPRASNVVTTTVHDPAFPVDFDSPDLADCVTLDAATGRAVTLTRTVDLASSGFPAGSVDSVVGYLAEHGEAGPAPGTSLVDLGGGQYALNADLESVDFTKTNPWTYDVVLTVEADGHTFESVQYWSFGAVPERTGFMWTGAGYVGKTLPDVVFRPGNSLYFDYWANLYGPASSPAPGVTLMSGPAVPAPYDDITLLYYSVGDHYVTSMNEAYWYGFSPIAGSTAVDAAFRAEGACPDGYVFFLTPADVTGDGAIDWRDLDAIDLESL